MDQTTDTADLTATEKYLNNVDEVSAESDSDREELAHDALLGGIRSGLNTITKTARKTLSTCQNKKELDEEVKKIEESSLKLLKLEKSFMKTASIVSNVIDDLASDYEDDDVQSCFLPEIDPLSNNENEGAGDAPKHNNPVPYIFKLSERNLASVTAFKEKLTKEFQTRLHSYQNTLTDSKLKDDKKFKALLDQIKYGRDDAETSMNTTVEREKVECGKPDKDDVEIDDDHSKQYWRCGEAASSVRSKIPFPTDELQNYMYQPYDEDNDMDHSVLPSVDPFTKCLIQYPLKNKYCNHVFDRDALRNYIASNPSAKCPVHMCRNKRVLKLDHFVADSILTSHVRQKNCFE